MTKTCCDTMSVQLENPCPQHDDPADCPDSVVARSLDRSCHGLRIHDGGDSVVSIAYCPWCGTRLSRKKFARFGERRLWLDG